MGEPTPTLPVRLPRFAAGMRIGLFGGSFDPAHEGHVAASEVALRRLRLDRVWWIVSPGNPLKGWRPSPAADRIAYAASLIRDPRIVVSDLEIALGTPYSYDTIRYLQRRMPGVRLIWLVGADIFASFHRWRDWEKIAAIIPIAVVDRPGSTLSAVASPMARLLSGCRLPERDAAALPDRAPPAWVFLHDRRVSASSTALRQSGFAIRSAS